MINLDLSIPFIKTRGNWEKLAPKILIVFGLWNEAELILGALLAAALKTAVIVEPALTTTLMVALVEKIDAVSLPLLENESRVRGCGHGDGRPGSVLRRAAPAPSANGVQGRIELNSRFDNAVARIGNGHSGICERGQHLIYCGGWGLGFNHGPRSRDVRGRHRGPAELIKPASWDRREYPLARSQQVQIRGTGTVYNSISNRAGQ